MATVNSSSSFTLYMMQNLKEYHFMFWLIVYLFMYKHKESFFDTQVIDRIKAIKLVEHCCTDSTLYSPYLDLFRGLSRK